MKLPRATHDPAELLEFYEEGLTSLGALCERTWHDRLQIVAEGRAARLWNADGVLHEMELRFASAETAAARDASREVFPGCPLTFRLAEALGVSPLPIEKFILPEVSPSRPPEPAVAEKIWRAQFPDVTRWQLLADGQQTFRPAFHFALLALMRCEIQAIDQHWSSHRIALSLSDGEADEALAGDVGYHQDSAGEAADIRWPAVEPGRIREQLSAALRRDLADDLATIRARQERGLQRELNRIDDYFENYERELTSRTRRSASENARLKLADRLTAAKIEHGRRRADQLARHEIRIHPYLGSAVVLAERAWGARLQIFRDHRPQVLEALFVPRTRQWKIAPEPAN